MQGQLVQFFPNDYCFECNTYRSIVGITSDNKEVTIDNEYILNKPNIDLVKLRCKKCKKEFDIDWTKDRKPKPRLNDLGLNLFLKSM